ncbi:unnamed protein product [Agarophyton chilense]
MVQLRSGKKTRREAPKPLSDATNSTVLNLGVVGYDEPKQTPTEKTPTKKTPTKKTAERQASQQTATNAAKRGKQETNARQTPHKSATRSRNGAPARSAAKKVSTKGEMKMKEAQIFAEKGEYDGSGAEAPSACSASKSSFLRSGAGDRRRKRLSEEKSRARKETEWAEMRGHACVVASARVGVALECESADVTIRLKEEAHSMVQFGLNGSAASYERLVLHEGRRKENAGWDEQLEGRQRVGQCDDMGWSDDETGECGERWCQRGETETDTIEGESEAEEVESRSSLSSYLSATFARGRPDDEDGLGVEVMGDPNKEPMFL